MIGWYSDTKMDKKETLITYCGLIINHHIHIHNKMYWYVPGQGGNWWSFKSSLIWVSKAKVMLWHLSLLCWILSEIACSGLVYDTRDIMAAALLCFYLSSKLVNKYKFSLTIMKCWHRGTGLATWDPTNSPLRSSPETWNMIYLPRRSQWSLPRFCFGWG